ncbi:MAG: M20 family metallopeptidase [Fretibacterium sp.]|nr:M20 family metallopeptidase [Fretibacterium sp.]
MKQRMYDAIDALKPELSAMSDDIYDHPEVGLAEHHASELLCAWLEKRGFSVERGVGGLPTAFRATFHHGTGGRSIGLLCEYDALPGLGHACGHQMQGPCILGAAAALKDSGIEQAFSVVVYGTPAEETVSGKALMLQDGGCFHDIDVALMMHGSGETTTDIKSMALTRFIVTYHGKAAHSAIRPEEGRSSLDAMILAFQGTEFLREHVREDTRIHYNILDGGGTEANVVPAKTAAQFYVRSYNRAYLKNVIERFEKVLRGAAMMTETEVEINREKDIDNKIPALKLNDVIMENARAVGAPVIRPPRQKTGSTDLGNVMQIMPGSCIRVAFVPEGSPSHSQAYLEAGKTEKAHDAIIYGAKILAGTAADLITRPGLMDSIWQEFRDSKAKLEREAGV